MADFPVEVRGLVDSGAHLVLIQPELAKLLGLRLFRLEKPIAVSVTMQNDSKKITTLRDFVKIAPFSPDSQWTSRTVRAIVAPGLCAPIIFGLPFLECNSLVIDAEARSVVDKRSGFDLLNPPVIPVPLVPKLKLCDKIKQTKDDVKLLKAELNWMCAVQKRDLVKRNAFEIVKQVDAVAAVRTRIDQLANIDKIEKWEAQMKSAQFRIDTL